MRFLILFFLFFSLLIPSSSFASSDYVLPYPSFMPGSKFYAAHLLWENMMKYWHFGSFSQFKYNISLADKYLVEAKTLFEYRQYYLGYKALLKSDSYFHKASQVLFIAKNEKKNIAQKKNTFQDAAREHIKVLRNMEQLVPEEIVWQEENSKPLKLNIHKSIDQSTKIRAAFI